ncbi:MAG: SAM-dependent methyltransferase, partial [Bdellovibrionales bacterium]|nr:SAM-dependent methyltransferase [Bdellovibrionales bacterium]
WLSSRSPHRFNPLGLSLVEIESVDPQGVWVRGVDLIEGTPILDIKPYIPEDRALAARFGWIGENDFLEKTIH